MDKKKRHIELLAPARTADIGIEAVLHGADAVYIGACDFGARAAAGNSCDDIRRLCTFAHQYGAKVYVTLNTILYDDELEAAKRLVEDLYDAGTDALIVQDTALLRLDLPPIELHASTQMDITTPERARMLYDSGFEQIVLARELSLDEIGEIHRLVPARLEAFVHGAMCISYSGRCLLSNFMIGRDANHGECAHPCRWKYALMEEQRPGQYYPIEEDERGTYILNSKDLCMIRYIPELVGSGLASLKIEGRMKSSFYVAHVVSAYRKAIDAYYEDPEGWEFKEEWMNELLKVSHRQFTTGFYFDKPTDKDQNYETSQYTRDYVFTGVVKEYDPATGYAVIEQRNKMVLGDEIEVFGPFTDFFVQKVEEMYNEQGDPIESCPHPQEIIRMKMEGEVKPGWMLRKRK